MRFNYRNRIPKKRLSLRVGAYALGDLAARTFPALQRRWSFPLEPVPAGEVGRTLGVERLSVVATPDTPEAVLSMLKVYGVSGVGESVRGSHALVELADVKLLGDTGAVVQGDRLIAVTGRLNWPRLATPRARPLRRLASDRAYYPMMSFPGTQTFHWLFDAVAPALGALEWAHEAGPVSLLVSTEATPLQCASIDFVTKRFRLSPPVAVGAEAVTADRLLVSVFEAFKPSALQRPKVAEALRELARYIVPSPTAGAPRRLYISRDDARKRRVVNEAELLPLLDRHGYQPVALGRLPMAAQVALFLNAERVIGPHGAGFTHIAWCPPGCSLVELFSQPGGAIRGSRTRWPDYWVLAKQRGHRYDAGYAGPVVDRNGGFEIAPALLRHYLDKLDRPEPHSP
jgi:hypothetical protein